MEDCQHRILINGERAYCNEGWTWYSFNKKIRVTTGWEGDREGHREEEISELGFEGCVGVHRVERGGHLVRQNSDSGTWSIKQYPYKKTQELTKDGKSRLVMLCQRSSRSILTVRVNACEGWACLKHSSAFVLCTEPCNLPESHMKHMFSGCLLGLLSRLLFIS